MFNQYPDRVVRERERKLITGLPTSSWYQLQCKGFAPRPIPLGRRACGWLLSDLTAWVEAQRAKRDERAS